MDDIKKTLLELRRYPISIAFFGVLALFIVLNLATPDKAKSELENRNLTQQPTFNTNIFSGSWAPDQWGTKLSLFATEASQFTTAYNDYTQDQLVGRDAWVSAQSFFELIQGKLENNGIWFARHNYQIAENSNMSPNQETMLAANTGYVEELARRHPGQVEVMIVPSPANILSPYLRYHPPQVDENAYLDEVFASLGAAGAGVIDLRPTFNANRDNYIFYRTDHHWTTTGGAWFAYLSYCETVGIQPKEPTAPLVEVEDFYGTNYSRSRKWGTVPDTLAYYDLPNPMTVYEYQLSGEISQDTRTVMDYGKLDEYDKYGAFLWGNNGYAVIEGKGEGSVLVIKDSYGNAFVPYLVENYAQVGIIDLRNWGLDAATSVDETIRAGGYDDILVLYSFDTFATDKEHILKMSDARQW